MPWKTRQPEFCLLQPMRVVFAGTPEFAVPSFRAVAHSPRAELVSVMTQPDRPSGRGRKVRCSPVKLQALERGIPVYQPETLKTQDAREWFVRLEPDLLVVVAYGMLFPAEFLEIPRQGCFNVHASLLPRWRGAAPIQRAIEAGDRVTGVSLMRIAAGLDTGPLLASRSVAIGSEETGGSLHDTLSVEGGQLLADSLEGLMSGGLGETEQDDARVTHAPKLSRSECPVDWTLPAARLERKVRAFAPWPGTTADFGEGVMKIHKVRLAEGRASAVPGQVLKADRAGIMIQTLAGALVIDTLQKPGGRIVSAAEYLNGRPMSIGTILPSSGKGASCM